MNTSELYRKALQLLATGHMMRVTFDQRLANVPSFCLDQLTPISLDFGRQAPTPIDDLEVTAEAISGTLRFAGAYHYCSVPWSAVYAIQLVGLAPAERDWTPFASKEGGKGDGPN